MKNVRQVDPRILASPLRTEIIGRFQTEGPLSIRALASHLSRPASGLYPHVRLLERSGLLAEQARRRSGRRDEAVYALTAPRVAGMNARDPEHRAAVAAAGQTALRMAGREFIAALGTRSTPRISRQRVWLSDDGARRAMALVRRLEALLAAENKRRRGKLHVVTTAIVPLVKR